MLKKHKWYVWGSVALIVLLSLFFIIINASAEVSSPSGSYSVYDNILYTESSSMSTAYYSTNSRGEYISVVSDFPGAGYATYRIAGSDFSLYPPNYNFTNVVFLLTGEVNWTQAPDTVAEGNTFQISFALMYQNEVVEMQTVTCPQGYREFVAMLDMDLSTFQSYGFGSGGFEITLLQPGLSSQAIIYNPRIYYEYRQELATSPPPTPTPTPLITPGLPILTVPPNNPNGDDWENFLPINEGAVITIRNMFLDFYEMPYIGGFIRLVIVVGMVASVGGLIISEVKRRK